MIKRVLLAFLVTALLMALPLTLFAAQSVPSSTARDFKISVKLTEAIAGNRPDVSLPAVWNDAFFQAGSYEYNHGLAKLSMLLSAAAYSEANIRDALTKLGCESILTEGYGSRGADTVGVVIGRRRVKAGSEVYNLIIVALPRTPGNQEWLSNLDIGDQDKNPQHAGFFAAASFAITRLRAYLGTYGSGPECKTKILLLGHSRGGAAANIMAKAVTDAGGVGGFPFAKENVYELLIIMINTAKAPYLAYLLYFMIVVVFTFKRR